VVSEKKSSILAICYNANINDFFENSKNGFGAILSRVEFQIDSYKTSHFKYLKQKYKNKTRKPKQYSTLVRAGITYIAVNANAHGRKTRPGMSEF